MPIEQGGSPANPDPSTETKQDDIITAINSSYLTEIARGNISGQKFGLLSGTNPNMTADTLETLWDQGGIYVPLISSTQLYASSTSASDTAVTLSITGLDNNYAEITRTVTLNGQNQVALSGEMLEVFRTFVTGSTEPLGDIYIAESDSLTGGVPQTASKIKDKVILGNNISFLGRYVVPAGKTAYGVKSYYLSEKGGSTIFKPLIKAFGGVNIADAKFGVYQNYLEFSIDDVSWPEKTTIEIRGTADNTNTLATAFVSFILIDN